jgi:hypothetical protein
VTSPTYAQLRAHEKRTAGMLADDDCVGELLLVGMGMARCLDLGDPVWPAGKSMPLKPIAYAIYGRYRLGMDMLLPLHRSAHGDCHPRKRILDVFFQDRRRYSATVDGDRGFHDATFGRPMVRRDGLCGRNPSYSSQRRLTDPATGQRRTVGACSQAACQKWFADLLARNAAELKANPAPQPPANPGGVLERHLPEIDWWKVWRHVDKDWTPPPEGERFERPKLTLVMSDGEDGSPVVATARPALTVHEGGWR